MRSARFDGFMSAIVVERNGAPSKKTWSVPGSKKFTLPLKVCARWCHLLSQGGWGCGMNVRRRTMLSPPFWLVTRLPLASTMTALRPLNPAAVPTPFVSAHAAPVA